jgi:hypothetical protein
MSGTAADGTLLAPGRGLTARLRGMPAAAGAGCMLALFAAYLASASLLGAPELLGNPADPGRLHPAVQFNAVLLAIAGFTMWTVLREPTPLARELAELRPQLDCDDATLRELVQRAWPSQRGSALALALGAGIGATLREVGSAIGTRAPQLAEWSFHDGWNVFVMIVLFGLMGLRIQQTARLARLFHDLGRNHVNVQLLDTGPLRVFARHGMRLALVWFIGSGIALLLFLDPWARGLTAGIIAAVVAIAVASLLLPSLGIHQRLREAKAAELACVRSEIAQRRAALLGAAPGDASDLPTLLAWEARVDGVAEWPFDAPFLVRFALLILIPLGSWLGGALVERVVDEVLG